MDNERNVMCVVMIYAKKTKAGKRCVQKNKTKKEKGENEMKIQSLIRKSQSIADSSSGALREQQNSLLSNSLRVFSGLDVWTSHMRKVTCPRVTTTTSSSL